MAKKKLDPVDIAAQQRAREQAEPRLYWLTREALSRNLGKLKVGQP